MNLPRGCTHHPREKQFIARDEPAIVRINTGPRYPENVHYKINHRSNTDIGRFFLGDWAKVGVELPPIAYSGAEYGARPKKPNITVVPNWPAFANERRVTVLGSTLGHLHTPDPTVPPVQEVYEFQSYGLMVLDRGGGALELWVARDGDKVAVPNNCHMTLHNLGGEDSPLITLDFANPDRNPANRLLLQELGPVLLVYYDDREVVFTLSANYINNGRQAGVRLNSVPPGVEERRVRIPRVGRVDLGGFLYGQLTDNPGLIAHLSRLGMQIRIAFPDVDLQRTSGGRLSSSLPLARLAGSNSPTYGYFFPLEEPPAKPGSMVAGEAEAAAKRESVVDYNPLDTRLIVLVEGSGDWVMKAYRPALKELAESGRSVSVYYTDDTRWPGDRGWVARLATWETYLDKADPHDFAIYLNLVPDVVFVVTPDFTHCATASSWVKARRPLVFVEKPFDSQLANVEALIQNLGHQQGTAVLGLDHYQLRSWQIHERMPEIDRHLGGSLRSVTFYMTESRPLESGRLRSIQYGLTLDMLPHMFALLTYFGDLRSVDEIEIQDAGQYSPLIARDEKTKEVMAEETVRQVFANETFSEVRFTFEDYSRAGFRVPCLGVVGKGLPQGKKYLEVLGASGAALRIDLSKKPDGDESGYPWGSVMLLAPDGGRRTGDRQVIDPYDSSRVLNISESWELESTSLVYRRLVEDLISKPADRKMVGRTLLCAEGKEIVRALDRIWWAIQQYRADKQEWPSRPLPGFALPAAAGTERS